MDDLTETQMREAVALADKIVDGAISVVKARDKTGVLTRRLSKVPGVIPHFEERMLLDAIAGSVALAIIEREAARGK